MFTRRTIQAFFSLGLGMFLVFGLLLFMKETGRAASINLFVSPAGSGTLCTQIDPCGLQTALSIATDGNAIYLGAGTYTGTGQAVITITHSITIYGGWDGTVASPPVRDPDAYPSVINGENQRRGIFISFNTAPALDGLVVTRGTATYVSFRPGYGGGIYARWANPIIVNNLITNNTASLDASIYGIGGGIAAEFPHQIVISGNHIISNTASRESLGSGGGINARGDSIQILNNIIMSNTAAMINGVNGFGGGMVLNNFEPSVIRGNQILGNVANTSGNGYGGGMDIGSSSVLTVTENVIRDNTASASRGLGFGGGIAAMSGRDTIITRNQIEDNIAQDGDTVAYTNHGGGIYCSAMDHAQISANQILRNVASRPGNGSGGGIYANQCDNLTINNNIVQENFGSIGDNNGYGGGVTVSRSENILLESNRIVSNTASNSIYGYGGGLHIAHSTSFTMANNIVSNNRANREGGAMSFESDPGQPVTGTLVNNTFAANSRGQGNGRIAIYTRPAYHHVVLTLTNNLFYSHTYGIYFTEGNTATLYNTLFYQHSDGNVGGDGTITEVDSITGADPRLTSDWHIAGNSPAVDAGRTVPWLLTDIDGDPRPIDSAYDIGADERERIIFIYLPLIIR
jgi:hypothetical protein